MKLRRFIGFGFLGVFLTGVLILAVTIFGLTGIAGSDVRFDDDRGYRYGLNQLMSNYWMTLDDPEICDRSYSGKWYCYKPLYYDIMNGIKEDGVWWSYYLFLLPMFVLVKTFQIITILGYTFGWLLAVVVPEPYIWDLWDIASISPILALVVGILVTGVFALRK